MGAVAAAAGALAAAHAAPSALVGIENQHPATYYEYAATLFGAGEKDAAVFWFYAGQLRFRIHLTCHQLELKPDGDPALLASLNESVGRMINEYAFGDPPALAATIEAVLAWDEATPNGFTSKSECADAVSGQRTGLSDLRTYVLTHPDEIRGAREGNGLENR
jgi:hypothetical protein